MNLFTKNFWITFRAFRAMGATNRQLINEAYRLTHDMAYRDEWVNDLTWIVNSPMIHPCDRRCLSGEQCFIPEDYAPCVQYVQ